MHQDDRTDPLAALCRSLAARIGLTAVAIFDRLPRDSAEVIHATPAFARLAVADRLAIGPLRALAAAGRPVCAAGGPLGLPGHHCLVQPVGGSVPAILVVVARRPQRLGPRLRDALEDAAAMLPALLAADDPARAPSARWECAERERPDADAMRGAVRPREAASRLVGALIGGPDAPPLAFLLIDIDRFRAIDEVLGGTAGDAVLAVTGSRLDGCLGPADRLIRLEGDRFLVVAPAAQDVRGLAARLGAAVAQRLELGGRIIAMRASIGIVVPGPRATSPEEIMNQAEAAVRRAKTQGGGRAEIHQPHLHAAVLDRSRLELDLRHALGNGELSLVFQPYVDLATGRPSGVEALLRWQHPVRGMIPPAAFIPLAEATGLILEIGMWAIAGACRIAAGWPGEFTLSVNVSPLQFHEPDFVERLDAALADSGFPADRLELEITETVLMRDNPEVDARLRALIARGIRIALDDFGTGYSALAYLARLPHHRIKLDRSFVGDIGRPATADLIRAIIALARANGIAVTAEGVERPDQIRAVAALGFTHAQGFATGAPAPHPAPFAPMSAPAPSFASGSAPSSGFVPAPATGPWPIPWPVPAGG